MTTEETNIVPAAPIAQPVPADQDERGLPTDILVIAEQPGELQAAQSQLCEWARGRLDELTKEHATAVDGLRMARERKYPQAAYRTLVRKLDEECLYHRKLLAGLEAGYCIVPNMPIDIIAVRVRSKRAVPTNYYSTYESTYGNPRLPTEPVVTNMEPGNGDYASPNPQPTYWDETKKDQTGKQITVHKARAKRLVDPRYPVHMRKARVIEACDRAQTLKVFDQIGILPSNRRQDPMLIGQIFRPNGRVVSFLIAWWVDTAVL